MCNQAIVQMHITEPYEMDGVKTTWTSAIFHVSAKVSLHAALMQSSVHSGHPADTELHIIEHHQVGFAYVC